MNRISQDHITLSTRILYILILNLNPDSPSLILIFQVVCVLKTSVAAVIDIFTINNEIGA